MFLRKFLKYILPVILIGVFMSCQGSKYKTGSIYHGFKLIKKQFVKEVNSECLVFEHVKSGARLLKIAADDANKTFSIGFKTTPESDYGTPHIMEHSVLNGSKNFPVKSPFDVLAKGSLNTFLNAMTGSDMTIYPVASMNNKDYFNLMHVYLDAVFYPNIYKDPRILKQEGWHHELKDEKSAVEYKGIVYNEMKGSFSNPSRELGYLMSKNLFPDNSYGFSSGGYPQAIPKLTYEHFINFHKKYYHPSNSYIYLYGDADLDKELAFINEQYLSNYDKPDEKIELTLQKPFDKMKEVSGYYPLPEGSKTADKTYLSLTWVVGEGKDQTLGMALDVISDALVNHESAPIRLALQKAGIGKDVSAYYDAELQNIINVEVQNANPSDAKKFYNIVVKELKNASENGIDRKVVEGIMNRNEFRLREGNSAQKGISNLFRIMRGWLYAENPLLGLEWEKPLAEVKKGIEKNILENTIKEKILNNPHSLLLTLAPKPGLENERKAKISAECAAYKAKLSKDEIKNLIAETKELIEYQKREDTPEALAAIPLLEIKDIDPKTEFYISNEKTVKDVKELSYQTFTNNVVYAKLLFNAQVIPQDKLQYASLLTEVLGNMDTKNYTYGELDNELNIHIGSFNTYLGTYMQNRDDDKTIASFIVSAKSMSDKTNKLLELAEEILIHSKIGDKERLKTVLTRHQARLDSYTKSNGLAFARMRLNSYFSNTGMFLELTEGLEYFWFVSELVKNFDQKSDEIVKNLEEVANLLFNKNNLTVVVTADEKDTKALNNNLPILTKNLSDSKVQKETWKFNFEKKNEGLLTASKVQYVVKGYNFKKLGYEWNGKIRVLNQILSRDWLTKQLRIIGGAYGGFSHFSPNGLCFFGSYRDPNLKETVVNFDNSPEFVKNFEADENVMTRYIIGTISRMDRPLTPSDKGNIALQNYIEQNTAEEHQADRDAVLATKVEDIKKMDKFINDILQQNALCVYGNEAKIKKEKQLFKNILQISK